MINVEALRQLAHKLDNLDVEVYRQADRDPYEPILAAGDPSSPLCIFGRDPGKDEVRLGVPFVGPGGRPVRQVLHRHFFGREARTADDLLATTACVFWANTVPYKPIGNQAWSLPVRRAFAPWIADLLARGWSGSDVVCMGENAFGWFGLHDPDTAATLATSWAAEPRFEGAPTPVTLTALDGTTRAVRVWSLPHPSPLNATWKGRFPALMAARVRAILGEPSDAPAPGVAR